MPNPRAQRPLSLQAVTEDIRSLAQPAQAMLDMLAGAAKGSVSATAGIGGDLESLARGLASAYRAPSGQRMDAFSQGLDQSTFLPTTAEVSAKLPDVVPQTAPLSRQHSAGYGQTMGEFIPTPGSGRVARGALNAVKSIPAALQHGATEFAKASAMGVPHVVKPKGGNWFGGNVERELGTLKRNKNAAASLEEMGRVYPPEVLATMSPETRAQVERAIPYLKEQSALNNWIDRNLTNYVKKEMATPEDPVRNLAEQGITHFPVAEEPGYWARHGQRGREDLGGEALAQSPLAKQWENRTDAMISRDTAQQHQDMMHLSPGMYSDKEAWIKNLPPETQLYRTEDRKFSPLDLGFDHIIDVLREDLASGRIRPEQLNKVSMEQAVRRTYEYDQEMAKKMREAQIKATEGMPVHKEYPEGYKWIELATPSKLPEKFSVSEKNGMFNVVDSATGNPLLLGRGQTLASFKTPEEAVSAYYKQNPKVLEEALKYEGDTMGHCVGGYCPDVMEGRSRIYSLRDAKGEPHVTIEVQPQKSKETLSPVDYFLSHYSSEPFKQRMLNHPDFAEMIDTGNIRNDRFSEFIKSTPEYESYVESKKVNDQIKQIKGKQNAAPKEQYLPFVQDFVRSGQWSDVGDIHHTGLRELPNKKYVNDEELSALASRHYPDHPGMTPADVVMHYERMKGMPDFQNEATKKFIEDLESGNYFPPEGMKRGGRVHISDNTDTMMMELGERKYGIGGKVLAGAKAGKKAAKEEMKASEALGKIEGRPLVITQADRTKVGGKWLGGPGFSSLQLEEGPHKAAEAVWGVKNPGTAKMILGGAERAGKDAVFTTMLGSPTQHQSNQMVFNELHRMFTKAAREGNLTPELHSLINQRLAAAIDKNNQNIFPADIDILDPNFRKIADTFDRRAIAGHLMGGVGVGGKKGQIIDYDKIIKHTTDPALIDAPTGALGNRLFTLSGGVIDRPDLHPAFPTILQGEDLGIAFTPALREMVMKDFIEKTRREKGRDPGVMDYTRGYPPAQLITEELLTEMQKAGKKKGGVIKKAAGGEITADDLTIEERPL